MTSLARSVARFLVLGLVSSALVASSYACSNDASSGVGTNTPDASTTSTATTPTAAPTNTAPPIHDAGNDQRAPLQALGSATFETNFAGAGFVALDALVKVEKRPSTSTPGQFVESYEIKASDSAGVCQTHQAGKRRARSKGFEIEIEKRAASAVAAAIPAGTYPLETSLATTPTVESEFDHQVYAEAGATSCVADDDAIDLASYTAASVVKNELVLTTVTATRVTGTFELRFTDGKFVKGTFDAPACDTSAAPTTITCE